MSSFNLFNRAEQEALVSNEICNVALQITGYDLESKNPKALGINLDTGAEMAISLDEERVNKAHRNKSFPAPSIRTFESKNSDRKRVLIGGIILFSGVTEKNGEYSASWATVFKHNKKTFTNPDDGSVIQGDSDAISFFYAPATFSSYVSRNGKSVGGVTLLLSNDKYGANLTEKLRNRLTIGDKLAAPRQYHGEKALEQTRKYAIALFERGLGVVIRASQANGVAGVYNVLSVDPMRNYGENASTASEWYEKRISPILNKPEILELVKNSALLFEVIPVLGATLSKNFKISSTSDAKSIENANRLNQRYNLLLPNGTRQLFYTLSHVALFQTSDMDALILSTIKPQLMQDTYIGADGAGYFLKTEFGEGTDSGLISTGYDLKSYKIAYKPKTKEQITEEAVNEAVEQEQSQPAYMGEPAAIFDDDIPF